MPYSTRKKEIVGVYLCHPITISMAPEQLVTKEQKRWRVVDLAAGIHEGNKATRALKKYRIRVMGK